MIPKRRRYRYLDCRFIFLCAFLYSAMAMAEVFTVGYLTNMHGRENPHRQGLVISGAISYALDVVNSNSSFMKGHKLEMIYDDTEGDTIIGTNVTIQQWKKGAIAFFGPEDSCEVEATVAASLNLPMISYKCADSRVSDKSFYRTFARTNPSDKGVVRSILVLLRYYRWRKFTIVSEQNNPYLTVAKSLEQQATTNNLTVNRGRGVQYFANLHVCCEDGMPCCNDVFAKVVEDTYKTTRVYVFFGSRADLIRFSTMLQMRKLLDNGEYVILYIDFEAYSESVSYIYFWRMDMRPHHVDMALKAAKSLLVIVPSPPKDKGYREFVERVREYNMKEPFKFPNALPYAKHITEFAAYLYDSVILYAEALAGALEEGQDPRNGTHIIQKIISKETYQSVTGAWLHMDKNGDVEGNYTVLSLQPAPPNLSLKGYGDSRNLSHVMLPMATFQYDEIKHKPIFTLLDVDLSWVAPPDEPPCGFDGSACIDPPGLIREIVSGILLFILMVLSVTCYIMYKKWKYEQEISGLLWRIPLQDIQRCGSDGILSSLSKLSVASQMSLESRLTGQTFTQTALYKGTLVATKTLKFKSKNVEIQRETKKEMKTMRELHHDNINPFIGACVQPHYILLVTEYCAKGSLKDILENSDIKLDHMFIASLVFDLIKGMIFLHDSDLRVHGNLKSSNCVVTSRWVLQVTDYGLRELCTAAEEQLFLDYEHYAKLLWKAPELLRFPEKYPKGTQKGDVYSFAIVLHEIVLRKGPFGHIQMSPEEIVFRVREGPDPMTDEVFRPALGDVVLQDYVLHTMSECWAETPETRPDFRHIKERLKKMKDGITSNIMDNMMDMMERYANNLEELVEERTSQLAEEQKKTEALLHRMLPRTVAEQLMRGEPVIPESFDAVTIYFSDIVGFTEMSASSTPMEVVAFLNDLYTVFDSIIGHYDVYKVETIGDAYMVVSGLPIRNGEQHAAEIASMALDLLEAITNFRIRHRPHQMLKLRIGIHSGPVVAGVVGLTMPRYCLFGDTVNTASRMESNGEALKIHISDQCRRILERLGGYKIEPRGLINLKGKGEVKTYWLLGHDITRERRRPLLKNISLPPPLFNVREIDGWRPSPKIQRQRKHGSVITPESSFSKSFAIDDSTFLRPLRPLTRDAFQSDPWDGNELGWNAAFDASNPDSLENTDEGFDGQYQSSSRKSSNNSKITGREPETTSLTAVDEITRPLIYHDRDGVNHVRGMKPIRRDSYKRSWSADAIDLSRVSIRDWFANVFGRNASEKDSKPDNVGGLQTVKENEKEESVV